MDKRKSNNHTSERNKKSARPHIPAWLDMPIYFDEVPIQGHQLLSISREGLAEALQQLLKSQSRTRQS
jgi:hypothetical protein